MPGWLIGVARRPLRVRPDRIPRPLGAVVVVLWAAWIAIALALLVPGLIEPFGDDPFGADSFRAATAGVGENGRFLVVWSVLLGTSALVGAAAVVLLLLRARPRATVGAAFVAFGSSLAPVFFLVTAGAFAGLAVTLLLAVAATVLAAVAGGRTTAAIAGERADLAERAERAERPERPDGHPSPRTLLVALAGLATASTWVPLALDGYTSEIPLSLVSSYTVLGVTAVAVTGFVTLSGVAAAAESANSTAGSLDRRALPPVLTAAVLAAVAVLLVLRFGPLNEVFGELESELWSLRTWSSRPHALVLALLIVGFALRSTRRPFAARGQRAVTVIVTLAAGLSNLVLVGAAVVLFVVLFVTGSITDPSSQLGWIHLAGLVVVLVLLPLAVLPRSRGTTGRVGAVVGLVYLVPMTLSLTLQLRDTEVPAFWASPTQVVVLLVALVVVAFVAGEVRRARGLPPLLDRGMLLRLAVIPVVAIHAGELLPAVWSDALDRPLVVVLSLVAFLFLSPAPVADARTTARRLVAASALQLAILGTFATTIVLDYDAEMFTVVAVIWLAVPVSAVLVCRVVPTALPSAPGEHDLADAPPRLDDAVGLGESRGVDRRDDAGDGAAHGPGVDELGHRVE